MKNKIKKKLFIIFLIIVFLLTFFAIVFILKNKIDKQGGLNILKNTTQNTNVVELEEDFDDEEPAIEEGMEDEYAKEIYGEEESENNQQLATPEQEGLRDDFYTESPIEVTSPIYLATVKNIIQTFLNDLSSMSKKSYLNRTDIYSISNSDLRKKAYDRLSVDFINENEIDINNISTKMHLSYSSFTININKMLQYIIRDNQVMRFAVSLNIEDEEKGSKANNFIVYLDYENRTFEIEPAGSGDINNIKLDSNISKINKNINNTYSYFYSE